MDWWLFVGVVVIILDPQIFVRAAEQDQCNCVASTYCSSLSSISPGEQRRWVRDNLCDSSAGAEADNIDQLFGTPPPFSGEYVCCPKSAEGDSGINTDWDQQERGQTYNRRQDQEQSANVDPSFMSIFPRPGNQRPYHRGQNQRPTNQGQQWQNGRDLNQRPGDQQPYTRGQNQRPFGFQGPYYPGSMQNQNSYMGGNGGQCSRLTSFPPKPETGCCGRDPSDSDRIIGGQVTEIDQFPWTVLLETTFDYGSRRAAFNCGGSLISARYVLTAAHCVHEDGARVAGVEVTLAEYDKRTFPTDCVQSYEGRRCVENIVTKAEDIIPHPQYDDQRLHNDIALLRLQIRAPYTDFIRPICLTPINIDSPDLANLPLSVAGWGRNGKRNSPVKQSTTVNLVPQRDCRRHYGDLTRAHLCAAGHTGEDTCKGDSGGPLMILYEGKYFVSGIVSGKRSDSPCGTSVPSLYTNVYQYLGWIASNIR